MEQSTVRVVLLVVGALVALVSVLADALGLGRVEGFGWKQKLGFIVGIALIVAGSFLRRRRG